MKTSNLTINFFSLDYSICYWYQSNDFLPQYRELISGIVMKINSNNVLICDRIQTKIIGADERVDKDTKVQNCCIIQ